MVGCRSGSVNLGRGAVSLKAVLPGPQRRERRDVVGQRMPGVRCGGRLTAGSAARRNGLVASSSADRRRQRRLAAVALGLLARLSLPRSRHWPVRPRARSEGSRACIRARSTRACRAAARELAKRRPHLLRRAFEQLARNRPRTACRRRTRRRAVHAPGERDVPRGMAGDVEHVQRDARCRGTSTRVVFRERTRARRESTRAPDRTPARAEALDERRARRPRDRDGDASRGSREIVRPSRSR